MAEETFVLAIDIGGTFTDLVLLDCHTGRQAVAKVPTSYPDPSEALLTGIGSVLASVNPGSVQRVIHGTTLVTNALIERKGARTGLITTAGFRDALEIGREGRYDIYDLWLVLPEPLVERRLRFGAPERMNVRGEVLENLNETSIHEACRIFLEEGVEAVAICFLHAYANPEHERRAEQIVRGTMRGVAVSVSHQVAPELREYDRTSTTVANAYVQPLAGRYLAGLAKGLETKGITAPLHIMLSNGGVCSAETAAAFPVRLVESGPSGGALSGAYWAEQSDRHNVLAFDMGGTTAKAVLGSEGAFPITTESEVARVYRFKRGSGLPLLVPVLDMIEIGAGGGSIAHLNEMGLPAVGPESAGSVPGPACYAPGGEEPTVTDADLILGMLNPDYFLGGKMALDTYSAQSAVHRLAARLGMDVCRMAWGIHRMVNENMANAARVHAAERGIDIRGYTMVATGGAGPVHACGVAERLGIVSVIVPPAAGVSSAFGLMLAPISFDFARSYVARLEAVDYERLNGLFEEMEREGEDVLREAGVTSVQMRVERTADMRYVGQGHEIRIPVPGGELDSGRAVKIRTAFDREYTRKFTRTCEGVEIESVHWRVRMSGPKPDLGDVETACSAGGDPRKGVREVLFNAESGPEPTPVFDRYRMSAGFRATGPVIVEEVESTAVVPRGWTVSAEACGNLFLRRLEGSAMMPADKLDAVLLEVLWNRLISIVNEQAAALMHASFTTVVREAGDLSAGIFNRGGDMVAQAVTGTPGHINTMATCVRHFAKAHPIDSLKPGDSLLTNDPWLGSGHLHDITVVTPVFHHGRAVGWFANTCHAMDIGGRTLGADAREVFEEGLHIPIMFLFREGEVNRDLMEIVRANVRTPDSVVGDLYAQQAGNDVGAAKLVEMMAEYDMDDIESLTALILDRSEAATRDAIAEIPNGTYTDEVVIDGFDHPLKIAVSIHVKDRELTVDYNGTSPQVDRGINVVYNYTQAYTTYPLACSISPSVPNNEGSFRPVTVTAPEGSVLNARFPCAVGARHLIGHFLSQAVFGALSRAIPERVLADGSAGLWNTQLEGYDRDGRMFSYIFFSAGGMGARPTSDGLSATAFPSGIKGVPAEAIEAVSPVLMLKRELRPDSGGPGKFRGGLGQEMVLRMDTESAVLHSCMYDRTRSPARGFLGGGNGAVGEVVVSDGSRPHPKGKYEIQPGQTVTLRLPGGGGFFSPMARDPQRVLNDVRQGRVSLEAARDVYGVVVDTLNWEVDGAATEAIREASGQMEG